MSKNIKSLIVMVLISMSAVAQNKPFWNEIKEFEKSDSISMPRSNGIVFIGSSSVRMWSDLEQTFKRYDAINRGFGGSELTNANDYIKELVLVYKPRQVVIYSGENDVASGATSDKTYDRFVTFFTNLRKNLPKANITFISMKLSPSRAKFSKVILTANAKIKEFISGEKNAGYIDITSKMLDSTGANRPELFQPDMLHMKPAGYAIWTKEITPYLKKK
ncbi:GDSL-type esterase/lipase family protein [Pedobacter sp. JCM 36344]|uniref:GDSL-type esterase/lipase family protein n=1 Tax=Pedobacter sp. JCM 36344 TaxID=3374280 RepID=UPI0039792C75